MILGMISDTTFETAGTIVGTSASTLIAFQIYTELTNGKPSTLSVLYIVGFLLVFVFWTLYGLRFKRRALWLTNGIATLLQIGLLAVTLFK